MPPSTKASSPTHSKMLNGFALAFGAFLGLAFLKFPNPPVLEAMAAAPGGFWEWLFSSWPVRYAYPLLGLLLVIGLVLVRTPRGVSWRLAMLPLLWLGWILLSFTQTTEHQVGVLTVVHFAVCNVCFYLGLLILGRVKSATYLFAGIILGLLFVMVAGWEQHFGGLERTRDYFYTYIYPTQSEVPPDMLKRMQSDRIFATLFYPNSLAGLLLLVVPLTLGFIADAKGAFTSGARWLLSSLCLLAAAGCLIWSGSKAGWLLAMMGGVAVMMRCPVKRQLKLTVAAVLLVIGLAGFAVKYLSFFQRGATSVVARFDYWAAASHNAGQHPFWGTGPGSFADVYQKLKSPESEMARLVHNDYLQQASDSGLPAAVLFGGFVVWLFWFSRRVWLRSSWTEYGVVLGLALFAAQSVVEFGFYIPATAWCWFTLAGWLIARVGIGFDNETRTP